MRKRKIPKRLQKSFSNVICRIKSQAPNLHIASTTSRLLNGCRHPKSLPLYATGGRLRRRKSNKSYQSESETEASESGAGAGQKDKSAATLEDIDRFLLENFRSLYCDKYESDREEGDEDSESPATYDSSQRSFETPDLTPDRRFFISPASSASVIEDSRTSRAQSDEAGCVDSSTVTAASFAKTAGLKTDLTKAKSLPTEDCIAVLKATANPLEDFRRSMGEVMEARARHGEKVDWSFMEELLFGYLRLNEKKHYRFVLDAFVDSVVDMRRSFGVGGGATEEEVSQKEAANKKK